MQLQTCRQGLIVQQMINPEPCHLQNAWPESSARKGDLIGVTWTAELEPSHKLVDKIVAMQDEGALLFIPPHACVSRVQEIHQEKHEVALTFRLRLAISAWARKQRSSSATPTAISTCGTPGQEGTWLMIRLDLRALWFWRKWTTKLMLAKLKEPPPGYRYITHTANL